MGSEMCIRDRDLTDISNIQFISESGFKIKKYVTLNFIAEKYRKEIKPQNVVILTKILKISRKVLT